MKYIKIFENFRINEKIRFYNSSGKWFSSGGNLNSITKHKELYGDDITFSIDGIPKVFSTISEYEDYKKIPSNSSLFNSEEAKKMLLQKRNIFGYWDLANALDIKSLLIFLKENNITFKYDSYSNKLDIEIESTDLHIKKSLISELNKIESDKIDFNKTDDVILITPIKYY